MILFSWQGNSQNKFGEWTISAGATQSIWRWYHKIPFREYETDWKFTVGTQLNVDWGVLRRFSLGAGSVYHVHHFTVEDYSYQLNGQTYYESPTQTVRAFGIYYRAMIHMLSIYENTSEEVDVYWGFGQQFMTYNTSNNSSDSNFYTDSESSPEYYAAMAGVRYYPTDWFGFYGEVAVPGPYSIAIGASFRFGGRDKFFRKIF